VGVVRGEERGERGRRADCRSSRRSEARGGEAQNPHAKTQPPEMPVGGWRCQMRMATRFTMIMTARIMTMMVMMMMMMIPMASGPYRCNR
jgi:hypothetical protein